MPAHDETKESVQQELLQELRDLQTVLDSEADHDIPILSDVVQVQHPPATEALVTTDDLDTVDAIVKDELNSGEDGIPVLESETMDNSVGNSSAEPAAEEQSLDQLLAAEASKSAPFALIESAGQDYDSSAAESLIEDGLNEALQPLTEQMDDEALRLVEKLVAEHSELIRQELNLRLDAKSKQLRAELTTQHDDSS
ncbi:MAG: hypothetical protein ACR2P1_12625 [Pseudomonadales bacterium]